MNEQKNQCPSQFQVIHITEYSRYLASLQTYLRSDLRTHPLLESISKRLKTIRRIHATNLLTRFLSVFYLSLSLILSFFFFSFLFISLLFLLTRIHRLELFFPTSSHTWNFFFPSFKQFEFRFNSMAILASAFLRYYADTLESTP